MINFTIRQIELFIEIAKQKSLTQAAVKLNMTQSAASMSLKEFERALNGPVFNRIGKGLVLNGRGKALLPKAENILSGIHEMSDIGEEHSDKLSGRVVIGCSTTIANYFMPAKIKELLDKNPQTEIILRVGNTFDIAQYIISGEADIGLIEGDIEDKKIVKENWLKDELVLIAPPDHILAGKKNVAAAELAGQQWLLREKGSGTLSAIEESLKKRGLKLNKVHEIGHTEAIKRAVEAGMGLSWLSGIAVEREVKAGTLAIIQSPFKISRWFRIITYKDRYQSRLVKSVHGWLKLIKTE